MFMEARVVILALALGITSAPSLATTSCSTVAACIFGQNTGSGIGVEGTSASGSGVVGTSNGGTGVLASSTSGTGLQARSQSGSAIVAQADNFGVTAVVASSVNGLALGVQSSNGTGIVSNVTGFGSSIQGNANSGSGVAGIATSGYGLYGYSSTGTAVDAVTNTGATAVNAQSYHRTGATVSATNDGGGPGVVARGTPAMLALGTTAGLEVQLGTNPGSRATALQLYADTGRRGSAPQPGNILIGTSTVGTSSRQTTKDVVSIDGVGNEILAGRLTQSGTPLLRTRTSSDGVTVATFGSRAATPTLEDVGTATLTQGKTYVSIERLFAAAIDRHAPYFVFITPRGDNKGLYVTDATHAGFAVRESAGGRATLAFDYRIVAKPYDTESMRLPSMQSLPDLHDSDRTPTNVAAVASGTAHVRRR